MEIFIKKQENHISDCWAFWLRLLNRSTHHCFDWLCCEMVKVLLWCIYYFHVFILFTMAVLNKCKSETIVSVQYRYSLWMYFLMPQCHCARITLLFSVGSVSCLFNVIFQQCFCNMELLRIIYLLAYHFFLRRKSGKWLLVSFSAWFLHRICQTTLGTQFGLSETNVFIRELHSSKWTWVWFVALPKVQIRSM